MLNRFKLTIRKLKSIVPYQNKLTTKPVSKVFGFDRGLPIDRYYIEKFLSENKQLIKGIILEISESTYTKKFGGKNVKKSVVMSFTKGKNVDLIADLNTGKGLKVGIADCFICTQTYPFIYEVKKAIKNSLMLLKPEGTLLVTVPGITQISRYDMNRWGHYWSFTNLSLKKLFNEFVPEKYIRIKTYGNVKSAYAFLYGLAQHELSREELEYHDSDYQLIIGAVVTKPKSNQ